MRVLALSACRDEPYIFGLLKAGAAGYLLKDEMMGNIIAAVRGVAQGEADRFSRPVAEQVAQRARGERPAKLTARELAVLRLRAQGLHNRNIAQALEITESTVKFHVGNIYRKLGVRSRAEAILVAVREGESRRGYLD